MALVFNDNLKINAPKPIDDRYLNIISTYTSIAAANAATVGRRHIGLTVNINNIEYWYAMGLLDGDLVLKFSLGYTAENQANKVDVISGSSSIEYPTENAVVNYVASKIPTDYSKVVYVDSNNPNSATIFDLNNPPTINDNLLKNDVNNIYIGLDASTWVYITSPAGYVTKIVTATTSNFYLGGTTTDAGNTKTGAIERPGTVGGSPATAFNHFVTKAQLDLKANNLITTNVQTGTTYTIVAADLGKQIIFTNVAAVVCTIPSGLGAGFTCEVLQAGTGQVSFIASGTVLRVSSFELPSIVERYGVVGIDNTNIAEEYNLYGKLTSI